MVDSCFDKGTRWGGFSQRFAASRRKAIVLIASYYWCRSVCVLYYGVRICIKLNCPRSCESDLFRCTSKAQSPGEIDAALSGAWDYAVVSLAHPVDLSCSKFLNPRHFFFSTARPPTQIFASSNTFSTQLATPMSGRD